MLNIKPIFSFVDFETNFNLPSSRWLLGITKSRMYTWEMELKIAYENMK